VKTAKLGSGGYLLGFIKSVSNKDLEHGTEEMIGDKSEFEDYYSNRFGKGFAGFESEYSQYRRRNNQQLSSVQCQEYIQCFKILGFTSMKEVFHQIISSCKNATHSVEELFMHLQALLCNDFPNQGDIANILFSSLYAQFVMKQTDKEKFPAFENLHSDQFPKETLTFKVEIDGVVLERQFLYELKTLDQFQADVCSDPVSQHVIEAIDDEVEVIEIKEEPDNDDMEVVEGVSENYRPGNDDCVDKTEEVLHELDTLPEPVAACSSLEN